jgi:hypothetical protein
MTHANKHLKALETLLATLGFRVRYEKGNFRAGACLLKGQRVIVMNKHYTAESKFYSLRSLLMQLLREDSEAVVPEEEKENWEALQAL